MYAIVKRILIILALSQFTYIIAYGQANRALFGFQEFKSDNIKPFKKWNALRSRHAQENITQELSFQSVFNKPCRMTKNFKCASDEWLDVINSLKDENQIKKIDSINAYLNKTPYVTDMVNWRQKDYWATLNQFFSRNGDCEDYAIAKYYSLKELGFSSDQMRIVVVEDTNLDIAHAVLAVYSEGKTWILDNQISKIVEQEKIIHYKPLYSINEKSWWLHKKPS